MEIEINGIRYKEREAKPTTKAQSKMVALSAMLVGMGMMYTTRSSQGGKGSMPDYNLVEEFKLIQNKTSNLSRSEREYVVKKFNRIFKQID